MPPPATSSASAPTAPAPSRVGRRDRREDLLAAAARRFMADGLRSTTMEEIAKEAGAGKATLYRHFANKDAVIDALIERESVRFGALVDEAVEAVDGAADRIEAAFATAVDFLVTHPVLIRGRDEGPAVLLERITSGASPFVRVAMERLEALVRDGVAAGELRDVDPRDTAEVLLRLVLSYFTLPPLEARLDDPGRLAAFARSVITVGLRRDES